jgi:coenzyme F420-0:L-glutamate ligase / coenzyme F420-1:gamma-L-glutamate ligase
MLTARALEGLPEIGAGADLASLIAAAAPPDAPLRDGDVVVVAHKAVSKAEGRVRRLDEVSPGERAEALAAAHGKDPRQVQVVLDETRELLRAERGVLICVTHHGFVCANAGVDASNAAAGGVGGVESLILLPVDPDASARALRARLHELTGVAPAVVITDSFGRAWRHGQTDVAIGAAGIAALEDWRGRTDSVGRELQATWIALADQIAGAADLARGKDSRQPVVVVSGLDRHVLPLGEHGRGAAALLRPAGEDLFR